MSDHNRKPNRRQYPAERGGTHFAHKFCRLLTKSAAAQEIGPEACWLLTVVAHQEDAKRYKSAANFWNDQLAPLCGFGSRKRLIAARQRAIDAGWLHYEPGAKGKIGRYWVLIPLEYADVSDTPVDEDEFCSDSELKAERNREHMRNGKGAPFYRYPKPYPCP